jgi:anaerobic selenocysteine-containing dehydrogenase
MKRVRSAVSPPGLAKEDRWIIHQLAKRMHGFTLKREKEFLTLEKMPPRFHPSKFHPSKNIPRYRGTRITDEVEDLRTLLASRGYDDV